MAYCYSCLVLEDSFSDQLAIEMVLDEYPQIKASYVKNAHSFLKEVGEKVFDLYVIDIVLNDWMTGIDLIQRIDDAEAWVIISSSLESKDYYQQFKDLNFKKFYIKKPLDEFIFKTNIESFLFSKKSSIVTSELYLSVKQGNYAYKVLADEISIIETNDHATTIYANGIKYTTYTPLKTYEEELKGGHFERVNRNTLINTKAIKRINVKESYVEIANQRVAISRNNKQLFIEKYMNEID